MGATFGRGQSSVAARTAECKAFALVTTDTGKFEENEMEVPRLDTEVSSCSGC